MKTFYLDFHVDYGCRNSGACCSAGWQIPLEQNRLEPIRDAIANRHITLASDGWLHTVADAPADVAGVLSHTHSGTCVFHHDHTCAIHTALGPQAKPIACQHFPRVCLIDQRGVFVTLSHYCPTAASMLFDNLADSAGLKPRATQTPRVARGFSPANIVAGPPLFPNGEVPEGLDARDALPPLLTERVLMDCDGYDAWERHLVRVLTSGHDPDAALDLLEADAVTLARWRPGLRSLRETIASLHDNARVAERVIDWTSERELFEFVRASLPPATALPPAHSDTACIWTMHVASRWRGVAPVIGKYLAAHAFASWMAYQGSGVISQVVALRAALATLRMEIVGSCATTGSELREPALREAIRRGDLLLRHLIDRDRFARACRSAGNLRPSR